jgi:outer membrane receptor protein involved in Fe transport
MPTQTIRNTLLILAFALRAFAGPTGTLTGRVTDSAGAPIPHAIVEARAIETNVATSGETNSSGLYNIPDLSPGMYRIIVRKTGLKTVVKPGLEIQVQDVVAMNFTLEAGSTIESITEPEGAPLISSEDSTVGITIGQRTLEDLPTLTRNPYDFVVLAPGANAAGVSRSIGFALNGQRVESSNLLLDGTDNNNAYTTGPGQSVPMAAVREYRLQTNNFSAEYGRNSGFVANVVMQSGGNDVHGDAFEYVRNSFLAANTFQNNALGISKPSFNRQQFGGSLSGPLRRDRLFIFIAEETILVRSTNAVKFYVPTPQLLAVSSSGTNAIFGRYGPPGGLSSTDVRMRKVCPYSMTCDPATRAGLITIPAFAAVTVNGPIDAGAGAPQNTVLWTARTDYHFDSRSTLTARYAFQDFSQFPVVTQPYSRDLDRGSLGRNQSAMLGFTRGLEGTTVLESRFVFDRIQQVLPQVPSDGMPYFIITGEGAPLPSGANGEGGPQDTFQVSSAVATSHGRHNLRFGGEYLHLTDNRTPSETASTQRNRGQFCDLQGFVDGLLCSFQLSVDPRFSGVVNSPSFIPASPNRHYRYNSAAFFVQETWKLTPRLTVTPGLRYDYFGQQHSAGNERALDANFYYGHGSTIYDQIANGSLLPTVNAPGPYRNHFYLPDHHDFAPRAGLAYDLGGHSRTVLRSGGGIFYDRLPGIAGTALNPPTYELARIVNLNVTPSLLANAYGVLGGQAVPTNSTVIFHKDQNLKTAYIVAWNANIDHQIAGSFVASLTYVGSSGNRLYQLMNYNRQGSGMFVGRPDTRLYQNGSSFSTLGNQGHSSYHALQVRLERRTSAVRGLAFGVNYTWSHSIDNVSSVSGDDRVVGLSSYLLDPFNPALDKGSSDYNVRHRMVGHVLWQPLRENQNALLRHWEVAGIVSVQSGQPFSLTDSGVPGRDEVDNTRPRVAGPLPQILTGNRIVLDSRTPNSFLMLPLNLIRYSTGMCNPEAVPFACAPSVNGPYGGIIGRNNYERPGTVSDNVALMRRFDLRERFKIQLRIELYNLLNHSNLYVNRNSNNLALATFNTATASTPGVTASFGTPDRQPQEARQVVLALRLTF